MLYLDEYVSDPLFNDHTRYPLLSRSKLPLCDSLCPTGISLGLAIVVLHLVNLLLLHFPHIEVSA